MENLIKQLSKIYPCTKFVESIRDGHKVLLYNNEDLEWDDDFISKVIELAEENLNKEDLNDFTFLYDYLDEISSDSVQNIFGVNYIQNNINNTEMLQKTIQIPGILEVNIKVQNKKLSQVIESLNFKELKNSENLVIASQF